MPEAARPTVFVSHERDQLSLASAIVDLLEEAIGAADGSIACSAVPGYEGPIHAVLSGPPKAGPTAPRPIVLALPVSQPGSPVERDLRAADEAGVAVLQLGPYDGGDASLARSATRLPFSTDGLVAMVEDVAYALRTRPRLSQGARAAMGAVMEAGDGLFQAHSAPPQHVRSAPPPLPSRPAASVGSPVLPDGPSQSMTVPKQRIVSAVQCVDAGIDLCDCVYSALDAESVRLKLRTNFAPFLAAVGADFEQLSRFASDASDWLAAVDDRLEGLSDDLAWLGEWHVAGFQLATLCHLACLPGGSRPPDLNQQTAQAWESFCGACQDIGVPTESLTDFRAMLQSMAGADGDRSALVWCLDHLRGHAEQEDEARASGRRAVGA